MELNNTHRGILFMLLASLFFALTMMFAKLLSDNMGSVEVTFWRNLIGLFFIATISFNRPFKNVGGKPFTLVFRGVIGTIALLAFFYTISQSTLSSSIVYSKTEPIFTAILAFFLLKERLNRLSIFAIAIGFLGVVVISEFSFNYINIMGLMVGFMSALAYTSVRSLKVYYDERTVVLSFMIAGVILPALLMIVGSSIESPYLAFISDEFVMPSGIDWLWIALMGVAAGYGQIFMTRAYFYAKAAIVSTIGYSVILFATIFGIILGDSLPNIWLLSGALMIIGSGVMLSRAK